MDNYRIEHDTMGEVRVPADKYWGAQTERSYENFRIGTHRMPPEIIRAFAQIKKAAALANRALLPEPDFAERKTAYEAPRNETERRLCEAMEKVLDLDAYTGGFNLQIAWCTGRVAGESVLKEEYA